MFLTDFQTLTPEHHLPQDQIVRWLAAAHVQAQSHVAPMDGPQRQQLGEEIRESLLGVSGWPDRIQTRRSFLPDFLHYDWSAMEVYNLDESPRGRGIGRRMDVFMRTCERVFGQLFPPGAAAPDHLLHVTCTGYASPSAAQELVVERGWHDSTVVTHAYHMGCHAAIPALRIARGLLAAGTDARVEIAHTELCTLHFLPARHDVEQLVVQSLFADGVARYSATSRRPAGRSLQLLALEEQILPGTREGMSWVLGEYGMGMTLSKEVPGLVQSQVTGLVRRLLDSASSDANFAVHPGGPAIVDAVATQLNLKPHQLRHSNDVLRTRGNMSSATLPHIWAAMLDDENLDPSRPLVSLAFGPGLTLCGAVMRIVQEP